MAIQVADMSNIDELTKEGFVLVDIFGSQCGPCKLLAKSLEEIAFDYPFINIVEICADTNMEYAAKHQVMAVPTMLFMVDGEVKERHTGFKKADELMKLISPYIYQD